MDEVFGMKLSESNLEQDAEESRAGRYFHMFVLAVKPTIVFA
jgi:hypothetical protein